MMFPWSDNNTEMATFLYIKIISNLITCKELDSLGLAEYEECMVYK